MDENTKHNYGVDLLRIIAMLMIIAHHFSLHGGIEFDGTNVNSVFMSVLALGGKTGVNIFVLITGFYSSGKVRREKIINLIGDITFYSVGLTIVAVLCRYVTLNKKLLIKACFPLLFGNGYWFMVVYLELYLLSPLLNMLIKLLEKNLYEKYLIFFTCSLCVFPTIVSRFIQTNDFGYSSLIWFMYMYFIGAYLRLYGVPKFFGGYKISMYMVTGGLISAHILACVANEVYTDSGVVSMILECFADYNVNAIMPLLISISMFLVFEKIEIVKGRKMLGKVGAATLAVYLFHDNVNLRVMLWDMCKSVLKENDLSFIPTAIACIIVIFVIGAVIEITKKFVLKKLYDVMKSSYRRKNA